MLRRQLLFGVRDFVLDIMVALAFSGAEKNEACSSVAKQS